MEETHEAQWIIIIWPTASTRVQISLGIRQLKISTIQPIMLTSSYLYPGAHTNNEDYFVIASSVVAASNWMMVKLDNLALVIARTGDIATDGCCEP